MTVFKHDLPPAVLLLGPVDAGLLLLLGERGRMIRARQIGMDQGPLPNRLIFAGGVASGRMAAATALLPVVAAPILLRTLRVVPWSEGVR